MSQAHHRIAAALRGEGLNAKAINGWVYVLLHTGELLWIGAEYGQSLDTETRSGLTPDWFIHADESDA